MTRGIAPQPLKSDQEIIAEIEAAKKIDRPRTYLIPDAIFSEFTDVNIENEDFFSYVSYYVLIQLLEKVTDLNWVVHFPSNIPSGGRSIIHDVATYFGLTSHS